MTSMPSTIATAPGKLILTGEYAVLDGAPALVIAVDRRVVATRGTVLATTPFLLAVADELARRGAGDRAVELAREISVDSAAFYEGDTKLGLGSSAAVTAAATALALAETRDAGDRDVILDVALQAHANAQAARGARGSGADVAAAVHGGAIRFQAGRVEPLRWPAELQLIAFFTGHAADTVELVARVAAARRANAVTVDQALEVIADASRATCMAMSAPPGAAAAMMIGALSIASLAMELLAVATGTPLVPDCVTAARTAMQSLGGTAKTTGAGGGDVGVAVLPATANGTIATRMLIEAGCRPLALSLDVTGVMTGVMTGVDTRPGAQ